MGAINVAIPAALFGIQPTEFSTHYCKVQATEENKMQSAQNCKYSLRLRQINK